MSHSTQNRREFLEKMTLSVAGAGAAVSGNALAASPASAAPGDMPYRTLGSSGEKVSLLGLGGYHIGLQNDEQESIRIVRTAIDNGVNFMDNCWDYNDGISEIRMGKALRDGYRKKVFPDDQDRRPDQRRRRASRSMNPSSACRPTPSICCNFTKSFAPSDPDRIFGPGGSMEAALAAKKAGQNPLYRLYRPQGPRHPSEDARNRIPAWLHV